jgi:hypothetical protein
MRPSTQDPNGHPPPVSSSVDPARVLTEAAPIPDVAAYNVSGLLERWSSFGSCTGIELHYPGRLVWPPPWIGHIPFAFWLIEVLRPRVVVELGVHSGNSYCAFLQAIQSLGLTAQCYGIDHWRGDEHADYYGDDVYGELCSYHDPLYGSFSTLIRSTFEEALPYFSDRSVDLLHIDGFHTYESVAKDFSDWLPKVSARGVVLFHDINVREREFGVCRLWEEIAARYPTLAFVHSHGLGLAYLGSEPPPAPLRALLGTPDPDSIGRLRGYFARLGASMVDRFTLRQAEGIAGRLPATERALDAARADNRQHVETADRLRIELEQAAAHGAMLQDGLAGAQAEAARHIDAAARYQEELSAYRAEAARLSEAAARLEHELSLSRAETAQQTEAAARLQQELGAACAETDRHLEAIGALQQQCAAASSEIVRQTDAANLSQRELQQSRERALRLQTDLNEARAEIARQLEAVCMSRVSQDELTDQVAALGKELSRARGRIGEAISQRERATQLLRQQLVVTTGLQHELAAQRPTPAIAALVSRLATVKSVMPKPVRQFVKRRLLGVRP